jgi:rRNA maturation endonuclease Nob1
MSKRARKLALYLQDVLGWEVYSSKVTCKCGRVSYWRDEVFCPKCGTKLKHKRADVERRESHEDLEAAIAHALDEQP